MARIDLIPADRRARRRVARHLRAWIGAAGATAGVALLAIGVCTVRGNAVGADGIAERMAEAERQLTLVQTRVKSVEANRAGVRRELDANSAVVDQPDWGEALALVTALRDERVVLRWVGLIPMAARDADEKTDRAAGVGEPVDWMRLELHGLAMDQGDASRFLIALEESGGFDRVKLIDTSPETVLGRNATRFRIACELRGNGGAAP